MLLRALSIWPLGRSTVPGASKIRRMMVCCRVFLYALFPCSAAQHSLAERSEASRFPQACRRWRSEASDWSQPEARLGELGESRLETLERLRVQLNGSLSHTPWLDSKRLIRAILGNFGPYPAARGKTIYIITTDYSITILFLQLLLFILDYYYVCTTLLNILECVTSRLRFESPPDGLVHLGLNALAIAQDRLALHVLPPPSQSACASTHLMQLLLLKVPLK